MAGGSIVQTGGELSAASGEGTATSSGSIFVCVPNAGTSGASGRLVFSSGTASGGNSGDMCMGSGAATDGRAGSLVLTVGSGTSGKGGMMTLQAGRSEMRTGGKMSIMSGEGTATSSGSVLLTTANSGIGGSSGRLAFSSGTSKAVSYTHLTLPTKA